MTSPEGRFSLGLLDKDLLFVFLPFFLDLSSTLKQYNGECFTFNVNDFLFLLLTVVYRNIVVFDN